MTNPSIPPEPAHHWLLTDPDGRIWHYDQATCRWSTDEQQPPQRLLWDDLWRQHGPLHQAPGIRIR